MRVLVACEESQTVCKAFRAKGHEAYSCDILPSSGGHPEWHIQDDVLKHLDEGWDMMIAHPPCTHLASSGARYWKEKQKDGRQKRAIDFVKTLFKSRIEKIALENPSGILSTVWQKPNQYIHPYYFGEPFRKRTGLWLKNLPVLLTTNKVEPTASWHSGSTRGGKKKDGTRTPSKLPALKSGSFQRSKTFQGIADAMAEQWG